MDGSLDKKHFTLDIFVCSILLAITFCGHYASEHLAILNSTLSTTDALICVVCLRSFLFSIRCREKTSASKPMANVAGGIIITVSGTVFFHAVAVIFGAKFLESVAETYHFACLLTATTFVPCCFTFGVDQEAWYRVLAHNSPETSAESLVRTTTLCSILGAWFGAFPIPLDWDRPWQVWPISCVIGTIAGFIIGTAFSYLNFFIKERARSKIKLG